MTVQVTQSYIDLALELAALARPISLQYYRQLEAFEAKGDASPVTIADREIEARIRDVLAARVPGHGILGEEHGSDRIDGGWVWVIDPIDGTKSFITGKPLFGCLIALCHQGRPVLGVIEMPALGETYWGGPGLGAFFNGRPIRVRACRGVGEALLYATSPYMFKGPDREGFERVAAASRYPLFGADCYGYAVTAAGHAHLVVEASLQPYDFCAPAAVIEGAGGVACDWSGRPLTLRSDGRVVCGATPALVEETLGLLTAKG